MMNLFKIGKLKVLNGVPVNLEENGEIQAHVMPIKNFF